MPPGKHGQLRTYTPNMQRRIPIDLQRDQKKGRKENSTRGSLDSVSTQLVIPGTNTTYNYGNAFNNEARALSTAQLSRDNASLGPLGKARGHTGGQAGSKQPNKDEIALWGEITSWEKPARSAALATFRAGFVPPPHAAQTPPAPGTHVESFLVQKSPPGHSSCSCTARARLPLICARKRSASASRRSP